MSAFNPGVLDQNARLTGDYGWLTERQVIVTKMECSPFTPSLSRGRSWFDKPVLSEAEGLTTNGIRDVNRGKNSHFHPHRTYRIEGKAIPLSPGER